MSERKDVTVKIETATVGAEASIGSAIERAQESQIALLTRQLSDERERLRRARVLSSYGLELPAVRVELLDLADLQDWYGEYGLSPTVLAALENRPDA